jgi:uncharacterized protein YbjT (DUF2867 family)
MVSQTYPLGALATVFGGTGFVGRQIVRTLAQNGFRVRAAVRNPNLAGYLMPAGGVGQVTAVQANLRYPESIAAVLRGADVVVNAAGVKIENGRQTFEAVHAFGAGEVAKAAAKAGVRALIHISGLGADAASSSIYVASKARGEDAVRAAFPAATILQPSVIFGPGDDLLNRFGELARIAPVLPLPGGGATKLQPVFVGDVAQAAFAVLDSVAAAGRTYELGGPDVMTLREIAEYVLKITERRRILVTLPFPAANALASLTLLARTLTLGKLPSFLVTTRDQVELLRHDNVVSAAAVADKRDLAGLGVAPRTLDVVAPAYLERYRKSGQFALA